MRILYLLTHAGLFRNFDSTLRLLVDRGHELHVAFDSDRYPSSAFEELVRTSPRLTVGRTPSVRDDRWAALGRGVRAASDYIRYLDPRYAGAPKLRQRARKQVPAWLRVPGRPGPRAAALDRRLRSIERALPVSPAALAFVREQQADLVGLSPLFGSAAQLEILRAARSLGVPTCLTVASWDNLTNKGLIRETPDRVVVWNDMQREEAVVLHGVPFERVVVTGAQNFDEWFERSSSSNREEFTERLGLRPDRPYLLYLGSSSFIAPGEADFAAEWLSRVRACPALRDVGVLFRPHPQNARLWDRSDITADPQVAIYPPPASAPQQTGRADWSREDFYDSMHHAAAVIGVNTTAMIESAVLGRAVYTLLAPVFRDTQEGTLHFEHLRSAGGGLLHLSEDFETHLAQLADAIDRSSGPSERSRAFVAAFVRPHGLDRPATPLLVDALEAVAADGAHSPAEQRSAGRVPLETLALAALMAERAATLRAIIRKRARRQVGRLRRAYGAG